MTKVLITGGAGFVGGFLAKHSLEAGCSTLGLDIESPNAGWPAAAAFERCDVRDMPDLLKRVASFRPDRIFHLAAQSYPTVSLIRPYETMESNAGGTINVFECLRTAGITPTVVVACSSAEYGPVASSDLPVRESHPLRPLHPYGVSKVAQDLLTYQYFVNYSLPCVRIRIFNTTGPGKLGDVCSDLTKRAVEIEMGLRNGLLPVGNLTTRRAIMDVRDLVHALWLSPERCELGDVYNVGGNAIYSIQEVIETIRIRARATFEVAPESSLMRGCDEPVIAGDSTKFATRTGWRQQIPLSTTIGEMLDWWRVKLASEAATNPKKEDLLRIS